MPRSWNCPNAFPWKRYQALSEQLMNLPDVEYAEPDKVFHVTLTPTDPQYSNQWHYFAVGGGTYGINAPAAWNITTGLATTVVAVLDTGITNYVDLSGRNVPDMTLLVMRRPRMMATGETTTPVIRAIGSTLADTSLPAFVGCDVLDSSWHGTHVAGTIGANANGVGVVGIDWKAKILPVRVLGKCGGFLSDIVDGVRWAAGLPVPGVLANPNPAKVINIRIGGPGACTITYQNAINSVVAAGVTVVVTAGMRTPMRVALSLAIAMASLRWQPLPLIYRGIIAIMDPQ